MRCIGRLFGLVFLLIVAGVCWLYRDELLRWADHRLHPATVDLQVGRPTVAAYASAMHKLAAMQNDRRDSVVLSASETASLIARGVNFASGTALDSLSVELGDHSVRIRTMIDSTVIPASMRGIVPGGATRLDEVLLRGTLVPLHAGLGELTIDHLNVRGIPLPSDLIARVATQASGRGSGGRISVILPQMVGGFRIRPEGMTVYRDGAMR